MGPEDEGVPEGPAPPPMGPEDEGVAEGPEPPPTGPEGVWTGTLGTEDSELQTEVVMVVQTVTCDGEEPGAEETGMTWEVLETGVDMLLEGVQAPPPMEELELGLEPPAPAPELEEPEGLGEGDALEAGLETGLGLELGLEPPPPPELEQLSADRLTGRQPVWSFSLVSV